MRNSILLFFVTISLLCNCRVIDSEMQYLLSNSMPTNNEISGFIKDGELIELFNHHDIHDKLSGSYNYLLPESGFKCVAIQKYTNQILKLDIEIYDLGIEENALNVYNSLLPILFEEIKSTKFRAVISLESATKYITIYHWQQFFLRINTSAKTNNAYNNSKQFLYTIDAKLNKLN